jgi:hypothetical protein
MLSYIPIVFATHADPVGLGQVASLRPERYRGRFFPRDHAADLRLLYDLWTQLANESRPLDRQAIAKQLADVLENAEFC